MLTLNVNNTLYSNADGCKLYNLGAQELHDLDIYIMTDNKAAQEWLLTPNEDDTPKVQLEIDRFVGETETVAGQIFDIKAGTPGESFSNPITYSRTDSGVDDNAHIQILPSHNAIAQKPVKMIGGSIHSKVGEEWGKVRAVALQSEIDKDAFYNERSEWYINMATRDDSVRFNVVPSTSTNTAELDLYGKDIVFIVQQSQHKRLKKLYMYYDTDNEPPTIETTGVIY